MFIDARSIESGRVFRSEVCIIGAGAAGITLAVELAAGGIDVTLIESGGYRAEAATQELYSGSNLGHPYPILHSRLRFFGGSTNHWGGLCRRLDSRDFEKRAWIRESGWPITRSELDPFYERARELLDLPELSDRPDQSSPASDVQSPLLRFQGSAFEPILWQRSPPTRMGTKYRAAIADNPKITCVLNANVKELVPNTDANAIESVQTRTLGGRGLEFRAHDIVLCAGGIENARILLLSDSRVAGGIGNQHDLVGRYFSEHLNRSVAELAMFFETGRDVDSAGSFTSAQDGAGEVGVIPTRELQEKHSLLGCSIVGIGRVTPESASVDPAIEELLSGSKARGAGSVQRILLGALAEQSPNRDSRVSLSSEKDALGLRKVALDWKLAEQDLRSLRVTLEQFAVEAGRRAAARVRLNDLDKGPWITLSGHHMGTTRMSDNPKQGVTDRNGRVHGFANLFVAGSSIFPTASFVNPTLTIVALAISLADLLKRGRASRQ